jgi:hypothetical protein
VKNARGNGVRCRARLAVAGLMLAVTGVPLVGVSGVSAASTVTNPALATTSNGRFLNTIVLDNGVVTITPAPANVSTLQGVGHMTAKIWASSQFSGFDHQTLGYGYVTMKGTAKGEVTINHLLAWVGFANGNTSNVCTKSTSGKFRTNGEAVVVVGDAPLAPAVAYVPSGCGIPSRAGYTVPNEVVSFPWVRVGSANAHGIVTFRTATAHCGPISGTTRDRGPGVLEVLLYSQTPDWSAASCSATVLTIGVPLAKTAAKANALRLVPGNTSGPIRQVVNAVS